MSLDWADSLRAKWDAGAPLNAEDLDNFVDVMEANEEILTMDGQLITEQGEGLTLLDGVVNGSLAPEVANLASEVAELQNTGVDTLARSTASEALSDALTAISYNAVLSDALSSEVSARSTSDSQFGVAFAAIGSHLSSITSSAAVEHQHIAGSINSLSTSVHAEFQNLNANTHTNEDIVDVDVQVTNDDLGTFYGGTVVGTMPAWYDQAFEAGNVVFNHFVLTNDRYGSTGHYRQTLVINYQYLNADTQQLSDQYAQAWVRDVIVTEGSWTYADWENPDYYTRHEQDAIMAQRKAENDLVYSTVFDKIVADQDSTTISLETLDTNVITNGFLISLNQGFVVGDTLYLDTVWSQLKAAFVEQNTYQLDTYWFQGTSNDGTNVLHVMLQKWSDTQYGVWVYSGQTQIGQAVINGDAVITTIYTTLPNQLALPATFKSVDTITSTATNLDGIGKYLGWFMNVTYSTEVLNTVAVNNAYLDARITQQTQRVYMPLIGLGNTRELLNGYDTFYGIAPEIEDEQALPPAFSNYDLTMVNLETVRDSDGKGKYMIETIIQFANDSQMSQASRWADISGESQWSVWYTYGSTL